MILAAAIIFRMAARADDQQLIDSVRAGQLDAFAEIYRRHADKVYALFTRMLGPVAEREDLVQEAFVEAYRALPSFRGEAAFSTFLYRVALRVGCDGLRRIRRSPRLPVEDKDLEETAAPDASPLERAEARRELLRAFRLLESLSDKQRVAFVLVAVEGLSLAEAAKLLDAGEQAVKQRVLAARKELQRRIALEQTGDRHD